MSSSVMVPQAVTQPYPSRGHGSKGPWVYAARVVASNSGVRMNARRVQSRCGWHLAGQEAPREAD